MIKYKAYENALHLNVYSNPGFSSMNLTPIHNPHSVYKAALFFNDILWSLLAFSVTAFLLVEEVDPFHALDHGMTITIFAVAAIALFKPCNLYNYHAIYDPKRHVKLLMLSWGCSALIFLFVSAVLLLAAAASKVQLTATTVCIALVFLFLRKFVEAFSTRLLTIVGLSFLVVGWLGLIGEETASIFIRNYSFVLYGFLLSVITITFSRYLIVHRLFSRSLRRGFRRQTVLVGNNDQAKNIAEHVIKTKAPFWIAGVVGPSSEFGKTISVAKKRLGEVDQLHRIVEDHRVTEVIVTDETIDKRKLIAILDYCAVRRVNVWFPPGYLPVISVKLVISRFCGLEMIRLGAQKNLWFFNKMKYSIDALATLPIFLIQSPVFLAITAAIKLTSRGPVFYRATAIGKGGRSFTMYKFRSMYMDSDTAVHKAYVTKLIKGEIQNDEKNGKTLKLTNDDRITPVGRFIRKFSLDELPQLLNVLKGDMSLVGPRPCLPYEFEAYEDWHKKRVAIRPGISGLWQVTGRSEVSFEDMILLDLYYIYNCDLFTDFSILLETVFVVLKKKGAY